MKIKLTKTPNGIMDIYCEIDVMAHYNRNLSIREIVTKWIDFIGVDCKNYSVVFYDIEKEFKKCLLVKFLDDKPFEDFLDYRVESLTDLFDVNYLHFKVAVGGIGGEIAVKNGIHYYIRTRGEHLPKHVHCIKQNKNCKCILDTLNIEYKRNHHTQFTSKEEKNIKKYIKENREFIEKEWNRLNPNPS